MNYYLDYKDGLWWLRAFSTLIYVKAPWNKPQFSERYGHRKPIICLFGWRIFVMKGK